MLLHPNVTNKGTTVVTATVTGTFTATVSVLLSMVDAEDKALTPEST